jgi:hypothetical protein
MSRGLTDEGWETLHANLARHVNEVTCRLVASWPAATTFTSRPSDDCAFWRAESIGRNAIFRIASVTKPILGVAAIRLIEDGLMGSADG